MPFFLFFGGEKGINKGFCALFYDFSGQKGHKLMVLCPFFLFSRTKRAPFRDQGSSASLILVIDLNKTF